MNLYKHYLRFLVWLGAEPPDDQDLQKEQTSTTDSALSQLPPLRKATLYNLVKVSILFPFFLFLFIRFLLAGDWRTGIFIAGVWAGVTLFAISFLFQALVVFSIAIYTFSQGHPLVGLALLALTFYLLFAATVSDRDIAHAYATVRAVSPYGYKLLNKHHSRKDDWSKFLNWYLILFLIINGLIIMGYICQGIETLLFLFFDLP